MRLWIASSLAVVLFPIASAGDGWRPDPESARRAAEFVVKLSESSPRHDGVPLRRYEIRDLDHDGRFEVLQHSSEIEESAIGFLSIRNGPPTYWIDVFQEKDGEFRLSTRSFRWFLATRVAFYERWISELSREQSSRPSGESPILNSAKRNLERAKKLISQDAV